MSSVRSILISNRGPDFITGGGAVHYSQGGTSDAYRALATHLCDRWLCLCPANLDSAPVFSAFGDKLEVLFVDDQLYEGYYHWFISQYLYPILLRCHKQAIALSNYDDYIRVCDLVMNALRPYSPSRLLLCDYHLFRIPSLVDWQCQKVFFWFLPFLDTMQQSAIHRDIVDSLSRCDLIFFYTEHYMKNFLTALQYYFPDRPVTCKLVALVSGPDRTFLDTEGISVDDYSDCLRHDFGVEYSSDCKYFLSVSRLDFVKNIPLVVRGFESYLRLKGSDISSHLLIIASQHRKDSKVYIDEERCIRDAISQSPFGENISVSYRRFDRHELKILYKYSDAIVVGSRYDGMPITALEYALSNLGNGAIVTSNTTGISAFLGDSAFDFVSGQSEDLTRAFLALAFASDSVRRQKMNNAKLTIEKVTVEQWVARVGQILNSLGPVD
ncbi:MAG: trehalose-6-phosphate synthase [Anaerolineae bacterium]|nr:trehalose-6-phosphate synthase [Anaerolineae bacterium]